MSAKFNINYRPPSSTMYAMPSFLSALFPILNMCRLFRILTSVGFPGRRPAIILVSQYSRPWLSRSFFSHLYNVRGIPNQRRNVFTADVGPRHRYQCSPSQNWSSPGGNYSAPPSLLPMLLFPHVRLLHVFDITPWQLPYAVIFCSNAPYISASLPYSDHVVQYTAASRVSRSEHLRQWRSR